MSAELNLHPLESDSSKPAQKHSPAQLQDFDATSQVLVQTRVQEQMDADAAGDPEDILIAMDNGSADVDSVNSLNFHKGGDIDNSSNPPSIEELDAQIQNIKQQIDLRSQKDPKTIDDRKELISLRRQLAGLENQQSLLIDQQIAEEKTETAEQETIIDAENSTQAIQEVAIETKKGRLIEDFWTLRNFLSPEVLASFPKIDAILQKGDQLIWSTEYQGPENEAKLSEQIERITEQAVNYLKAEQNRPELVQIARSIQSHSPQEYQAFKSFLISQDSDFETIFPEIEQNIDDSFEASISAALPSSPDSGNLSSGFVSTKDDGTRVEVQTSEDGITRLLDLDGVNFPIESRVEDVDLSQAESERNAVLEDLWPKKQVTEFARDMLRENPDKDFADIKKEIKNTLGFEQYNELGIDTMQDAQQVLSALDAKIWEYADDIKAAKETFRQVAKDAIRKTRERYRERDEQTKLTLKTLKHSGLGLLGMDWVAREIQGGVLFPKIGSPFDAGNFDPSENNFGERAGESDNPTIHLEYIYRIANKIISGNPEEPFSLDPTLLSYGNPQPIANSPAALKNLLEWARIIGTAGIVDKDAVRRRLSMKVESNDT